MPTFTAQLNSISFTKSQNGPNSITVQLEFLNDPFGPPRTVQSGAGPVNYPAGTTADHTGGKRMDLYKDSFPGGVCLEEGSPTVKHGPPGNYNYQFDDETGTYVVNYTAL